MTRNEARAMLNLPAIDGGDELVTPLNVLTGGQASPNDVDGVESGVNSVQVSTKSNDGIRYKAAPEDYDAKEISAALRKFFKRQSVSLSNSLKKSGNFADWWDADRWENELTDDLTPIFQRQAARRGAQLYGLGRYYRKQRHYRGGHRQRRQLQPGRSLRQGD